MVAVVEAKNQPRFGMGRFHGDDSLDVGKRATRWLFAKNMAARPDRIALAGSQMPSS
jgi:hypothetical protein